MTFHSEPPVKIDWAPLTGKVSRREVKEFTRHQPRIRRSAYKSWFEISWVATMCLGTVALIFTLAADNPEETLLSGQLLALTAAVVLAMVLWTLRRRQSTYAASLRIQRFALANGFDFKLDGGPAEFSAVGFGGGRDGKKQNVLSLGGPHQVEIGTCQTLTGSGESTGVNNWRYAQLRLPFTLPHIVLDARGNRSRLQEDLQRSQRVELLGDAGKNFTAYAPAGYENDLKTLLTPEFFRDAPAFLKQWDMEIVDDTLYLYSESTISQKPDAIRSLAEACSYLEAYFPAWSQWSDAHVPVTAQNGNEPGFGRVAPQGRRLKTGVGWGVWVMLGIAASGLVLAVLEALGVVS